MEITHVNQQEMYLVQSRELLVSRHTRLCANVLPTRRNLWLEGLTALCLSVRAAVPSLYPNSPNMYAATATMTS